MADLDNLQASQSVKIAGADSSGNETTFVNATSSGEIRASDVINLGTGVQSQLSVGTSAIEVRVGGTRLTNRKLVTLYNNSNSIIYWGYSNAVTVSSGSPIVKGQFISWEVGDAQPVFVIAGSAANETRITEA